MVKKGNINNGRILLKTAVVKPIYNITPFTLLDYPDKTACIIWFAGCNMRCLYCYNPDIVEGKGTLSYDDALKFLATRKNLLDGVVLSGGECTIHKEIESFASEIKKLGMLVKVDTNGSNSKLIEKLIDNKMVDYVALDFKATADKYYSITQSHLFDSFEKTLDILVQSTIPFEIRTTVHSELIDQITLLKMIKFLDHKNYKGNYYIQNFVNDTPTIENIGNASRKIKSSDILQTKINVLIRN